MPPDQSNIKLTVNGKQHDLQLDPNTPLLYVLRNQLQLNGPKYGCGLGQCGACMVLIDGTAVMSCVLPVSAAEGQSITTLTGLLQEDGKLHPVQQAFVEEQAAQCGYCTNGMIQSTVALLGRDPAPDEQTIREALQVNLCRCGTQSRVLRAVQRAQELMK